MQADIALNTFPYSGQTTTFDCIWMGVPVVTLAGPTHASRVGVEILSRLGLEDWIAHSLPEYVEIAVAAAHNLSQLQHLRMELRSRIAASDLYHGRRLAAEVEGAYRRMWKRYCSVSGG